MSDDIDIEAEKAKLYSALGMDEEGNPPELVPELQACLYETNGITMLGHPFVHTWYTELQNGHYNTMLQAKTEEAERLAREHQWFPLLHVMYERPYRLRGFAKYAHQMTDKDYWSNLGGIWTDSENIWQNLGEWRAFLSSKRRYRDRLMDEDDRKIFRELPEELTLYRGTCAPDGIGCGMAWTLDKDKAQWFADRFQSVTGSEPTVIEGHVAKLHCLAYFGGRAEREIVVFPEFVKIL
jgi:hypothetical protein